MSGLILLKSQGVVESIHVEAAATTSLVHQAERSRQFFSRLASSSLPEYGEKTPTAEG